jgi:PAS domain S-box-containing protein
LGRPITRFIPQRFHAAHAGHIHKFADTGTTNRTMGPKNVLWAARTDGEEFQIEASISQVATGGKKLFTVILRDVTERVQAQAEREHLAAVVDSSDDASISKDLNGIINAWNRGAEKIFGYSAEEAVGKPMLMLFPNGQGKEEADILARIGRGESVEHFETHRVRKDGQIIDVSVTISPIRDGNGVVVGASKVARDITERIRAQEALRQSDVRRGFALDTAKIGDWDLDLTTLQATRSTLHDQIFGYAEPLPEWNFEIFLRHVHPDDRDRVRETFQSSIRQKKKSEFECRIVWPNGEIRWIWACGDQNRDSSGKATRMFGIVQDITERKRSEEVLRESEERFRLFIEHAPAALAMFDPEMRYLHLSRRWRSDYGLGERDMRGVSHYEVFPEIPARWKEVHRRALAGEVLRHEDDRFDRADGSMKWLRWEVRPWRDGAGAIAGILAFTEDITERKQAQDRLAEQAEELARQAEELAASQKALEAQTAILQSVLGSMGEGLVAVDEQGKFLLWNAAAEKMLGKSAANLVTHEWPERFGLYLADKVTPFPTDKLPVVRALNGEVSASEMFVRNSALPEGAWIEVSGGPRTDSRGVVCGGVVAFRDITERKRANDVLAGQAEELSRQTEQLLRSRNALEAQTRMLELILESVGEGLIAADRNGHFLIWNDAAKKLMGREAIDLPSQQWTTHYKVFLPDGVTAYAADRLPLARAMRGESVRVELMIEHPERAGGVFLEVAARPMRDAEGNLCGGVAVLRDITEQKRAAAALARQAEDLLRSQQALETQTLMLQSVLDSIGEGLVAADETGKFILWNPAATRIVGMGAEDVPPGEWNEHYGVYLPDTVTPFPPEQNPLLRAIRGEVCVAEMYLHNQELESGVWIETSASPLKGKDGVGHGGVIALRDITQRKIDEREIRKLNEELEERVSQRTSQLQAANHELEAFTYSVSHDLRAPLRHIGGFSRILIEDFGPTMDPEARHHLQRIEEGTHRMGLLVDELLNLARVGRHTVSLQVTNLNTLIEEVVSLLQPETEGRAVTWKISSLPLVKCDPVLIKQVFQNLIANALKFTRPRERAIIEISHQEKNGQLVIGVRDNGVGFNMKYSDKLFGVFQRLHRAEEFEGTGIGLATAHRILHKHGERIWAEAEPDKGAAFFFTLAIANATRTAVEAENKNAIVGAQS